VERGSRKIRARGGDLEVGTRSGASWACPFPGTCASREDAYAPRMTPVGARSRATGVARLITVHGALVAGCTEPASNMAQKQALGSGILIRFGEILWVEGIESAAFSCVRLYMRRRAPARGSWQFHRLRGSEAGSEAGSPESWLRGGALPFRPQAEQERWASRFCTVRPD
jgi:hypothetical protein